jgi:hypothetical protein
MGMNLMSACHKCKEKVFHYRRKENLTMMPFYKAHAGCMRENKTNVVTLDDQYQYEDWMDDESDYSEVNA